MSTHGIIGFRKGGKDKITYNHSDSYPDYLGKNIVDVCRRTTLEAFNKAFDNIVLVDEDEKATPDQIKAIPPEFADFSISSGAKDDWYCLLSKAQGKLEAYTEQGLTFMPDYCNFIKASLFCEWGYIINLDTNMLEIWKGFQKEPDQNNRYGTDEDGGYFPCKLIKEIPLASIYSSTVGIDTLLISDK